MITLERQKLDTVRRKIDEVDQEIVTLLAKRFKLVSKVPEIKKKFNMATIDPSREREILSNVAKWAEGMGIEGSYIVRIYRSILDNCTEFEERLVGNPKLSE